MVVDGVTPRLIGAPQELPVEVVVNVVVAKEELAPVQTDCTRKLYPVAAVRPVME